MIKQLYQTRGLSTVLRRTLNLHKPQLQFVPPRRRYINTSYNEQRKQNSKKTDALEIDLIASSLGLIATLAAVYFITPKIESKKPVKKVKSNVETTPTQKPILSEETSFTNDQATTDIDGPEFNVVESTNIEDNVAEPLDLPNEADAEEESEHIELEEIMVPGDINILNPHRTPSHYIHEEEKFQIKEKVDEIPVEQDLQLRKVVLTEKPVDNNQKGNGIVYSEEDHIDELIPSSSEIEPENKIEVITIKPEQDISVLNKDTLRKNDDISIINNLTDDIDSREMMVIQSQGKNDLTPTVQNTNNRQETGNLTSEEPLHNENNEVTQSIDNDMISSKLNENTETGNPQIDDISNENNDNVNNNEQNNEKAIEVEPVMQVKPSLIIENYVKDVEPVTDLEVNDEKQMTEVIDKGDLPLQDVPLSLTKDQANDILPHTVEGKPQLTNEKIIEDSISHPELEVNEVTSKVEETDDIPYQDIPLSITENQKDNILAHNVNEAQPKITETVTSSDNLNETMHKEQDQKVDKVFEQDQLKEVTTETPTIIKAIAAEEKPTVFELKETTPPKKQPKTSENGIVKNVIETKLEPVEEVQRAYDPDTGEINWDCPCLGGLAQGPCGEEFKLAFSCFVYSEKEPKGSECIRQFQGMQSCFQKHPDYYLNDEAKVNIEEEPSI